MSALVEIPVLPLRDVVVYPHMVIPLFVGRKKSIEALDAAMNNTDKQVLLVAQKEATDDNPSEKDIFDMGAVATILQLLKLPDGTVKVLVEGLKRAKIDTYVHTDPFLLAQVTIIEDNPIRSEEKEVLVRTLMSQFEKYVKLNKKIPIEIISSVSGIDDVGRLIDTIAAHMSLKVQEKQNILELSNLRARLEKLMILMESEINLLQIEGQIRNNVKKQMEKSQKEYYLNEQMKAIQQELGHETNELEEIKKKITDAGMPQEAYEKALSEYKKLLVMAPMSAEATVCRNYIDWMVSIPWVKKTKTKTDLVGAKAVLEADHYGLEKIKERIIEYLAVQKRVKKNKGAILCFVGPPGVGKTSLGESIARATGRTFLRMSLGGVRDEAEIRGHRRTYIGSMPGRILQKLAKAKVRNPLFLLDEIDKMAMDFRGDPAAALLEVLDPEQNATFNDHYIEVDYDLSDIMFIATANTYNIPPALLDRMEVIHLSGYTEDEKKNIALRYLLPKQIKNNGLKQDEISIAEDTILAIIRYYTRESGVRNLEREISKICRKILTRVLMGTDHEALQTLVVTPENLEEYLGVKRYRFGIAEERDQVGQVTGLAWTEVGGEILTIEAVVVDGTGKITTTGSLGDVMQESIKAAMTVVRSRAKSLGIYPDFDKEDIHVHVPEGATPKDGPSAGIAMCTALVSSLTQIPVRADVAMTGEITLRGEVLPIGGLKEKLLAARRAGIDHVIIPFENAKDLKEIPSNIKEHLTIHTVKWIDEVLAIALSRQASPITDLDIRNHKDAATAQEKREGH